MDARLVGLAFSRPLPSFPGMRKSAFEPCIPTRGTKVPDRPEWIHEVKHDGYRLIVSPYALAAADAPQRALGGLTPSR
jgi:hypothetical protein